LVATDRVSKQVILDALTTVGSTNLGTSKNRSPIGA
jgi:hypothetical protein